MKINYSDLKLSFLQYLAAKTGVDIDLSKINDTSIFSYSDEFQDFLSDEMGFDNSIFSFNLNDILALTLVNGQFVDGEAPEAADSEAPETTDGEAAAEETAALAATVLGAAEGTEAVDGAAEGTENTDETPTVEEPEATQNDG